MGWVFGIGKSMELSRLVSTLWSFFILSCSWEPKGRGSDYHCVKTSWVGFTVRVWFSPRSTTHGSVRTGASCANSTVATTKLQPYIINTACIQWRWLSVSFSETGFLALRLVSSVWDSFSENWWFILKTITSYTYTWAPHSEDIWFKGS